MFEQREDRADAGRAADRRARSNPNRVGQESIELTEHLIKEIHNILQAYRTAIPRIRIRRFLDVVATASAAHERAVEDLGAYLRRIGHTAPTRGDARGAFMRLRARLAPIAGDLAILRSMIENEERLREYFRHALDRDDLPRDLRRRIGTAWRDTRGHADSLRDLVRAADDR
jgi:hypothetical protein